MWRTQLQCDLDGEGTALVGPSGQLLGFCWAARVDEPPTLLLGFHALSSTSDVALTPSDTAGTVGEGTGAAGEGSGAQATEVDAGFAIGGWRVRAQRVVIDEPQDAPSEAWHLLSAIALRFECRYARTRSITPQTWRGWLLRLSFCVHRPAARARCAALPPAARC